MRKRCCRSKVLRESYHLPHDQQHEDDSGRTAAGIERASARRRRRERHPPPRRRRFSFSSRRPRSSSCCLLCWKMVACTEDEGGPPSRAHSSRASSDWCWPVAGQPAAQSCTWAAMIFSAAATSFSCSGSRARNNCTPTLLFDKHRTPPNTENCEKHFVHVRLRL